ncbi:MAG: hypothetical protein HY329_12730 [Chloroflexi bacterium]|nr:hypothetical protein [Chloroflexota bacterium]
MAAALDLAPTVGVGPACQALGVSRARFYRRRSPTPAVASSSPALEIGSVLPVTADPVAAEERSGPSVSGAASAAAVPPPDRARPHPRALGPEERQAVLAVLHSERFQDAAPAEVYATLLDEGTYLASERTC